MYCSNNLCFLQLIVLVLWDSNEMFWFQLTPMFKVFFFAAFTLDDTFWLTFVLVPICFRRIFYNFGYFFFVYAFVPKIFCFFSFFVNFSYVSSRKMLTKSGRCNLICFSLPPYFSVDSLFWWNLRCLQQFMCFASNLAFLFLSDGQFWFSFSVMIVVRFGFVFNSKKICLVSLSFYTRVFLSTG